MFDDDDASFQRLRDDAQKLFWGTDGGSHEKKEEEEEASNKTQRRRTHNQMRAILGTDCGGTINGELQRIGFNAWECN